MGMHIKATPVRMLGVAIFAALSMTVIGGGAAKAKDLDGDYTLTQDMTEQIVVVANKTVVLDLNGYNITTTGEDAIVVNDGATLVINGNGTVEAVGSGVAPLYNHRGTVTLNGGKFLKDENKGGYYSVLNQGAMTINDATIWMDNTTKNAIIMDRAKWAICLRFVLAILLQGMWWTGLKIPCFNWWKMKVKISSVSI